MNAPASPPLLRVLLRRNSRRRTPDENGRDIRVMVAMAMVAAGIVLGGGGTTNPLTEVLLQLLAAALMIAWAAAPGRAPRALSGWPLAICAIVVFLPAVQLIPLPPSIWQALPGREVERASLALVGAADRWMPWSIAPAQTLAVLLAMIPPLATMCMVASLDDDGRDNVLRVVLTLCLVSVGLGALQIAAPPGMTPTFYPYHHTGFVIGFQANKNAEVDVLLIGLLATAAVYMARPARRRHGTAMILTGAAALVLLFGAIFTGSRGGILLIPAAVLAALLMMQKDSIFGRRTMIVIAASALVALASAWTLRDNAALGKVAARFAADKDFRTELWTDTAYAIGQYWPVGGGMGTFVQLMTPVERLEVLDETVPSRAHNDFLELLLESGVVGPLVLAILAICVAFMIVKAMKRKEVTRPHLYFAVATFFIIAAHSVVDYPLRSMSLAMLSGVAAGLVAPARRFGDGTSQQAVAQ